MVVIEAQAVCITVLVARCYRPVVTEYSAVAYLSSFSAACCRQENAFAVAFACCPKTFGPVKLSWIPNAVVNQFLLFIGGRDSPTAAPFGLGNIVLGFKHSLVVNYTVNVFGAILGYCVVAAVAPFVCTPGVFALLYCFSPSVVTATLLGIQCSHIAGSPQGSAWQFKVNIFISVNELFLVEFGNQVKIFTGFETVAWLRAYRGGGALFVPTNESITVFSFCYGCNFFAARQCQ